MSSHFSSLIEWVDVYQPIGLKLHRRRFDLPDDWIDLFGIRTPEMGHVWFCQSQIKPRRAWYWLNWMATFYAAGRFTLPVFAVFTGLLPIVALSANGQPARNRDRVGRIMQCTHECRSGTSDLRSTSFFPLLRASFLNFVSTDERRTPRWRPICFSIQVEFHGHGMIL